MHASTTYVVPVGASYEERTTNTVTIALITVPMVTALLFGLGPLFLLAGWLSATSIRNHGADQISAGPTSPPGCSDRHLSCLSSGRARTTSGRERWERLSPGPSSSSNRCSSQTLVQFGSSLRC